MDPNRSRRDDEGAPKPPRGERASTPEKAGEKRSDARRGPDDDVPEETVVHGRKVAEEEGVTPDELKDSLPKAQREGGPGSEEAPEVVVGAESTDPMDPVVERDASLPPGEPRR